MYSAQLLDHFQNPRNAGEVADADAAVEIENPACGDILRLTLKTGEGCITRAQFKAKGCVAAIACGSALTELVVGRTLSEVQNLRREDVIRAVGGLPQAAYSASKAGLIGLTRDLAVQWSGRKGVRWKGRTYTMGETV